MCEILLSLFILFTLSCADFVNNDRVCVCFEDVYANSNFSLPVDIIQIPGTDDLFYVLEQYGKIQILNTTTKEIEPTPFLDLSTSIISLSVTSSDPRGLLSMALDPYYDISGGYYYVFYSAPSGGAADHRDRVVEFFTTDAMAGNSSSQRTILSVDHTYENNNAGFLSFGPDDMLYISLGDGGGTNDPDDNAEDTTKLLGSILRINPDPLNITARLGQYEIPTDNPFFGASGGVREEIWAYGLRNSPSCAFDNTTYSPPGTVLFTCNEHGLNHEEINFIMNGSDYGWNTLDAFTCNQPPLNCSSTGKENPIEFFAHSNLEPIEGVPISNSVSGGHFWSNLAYPADYLGRYLFATQSGSLFTLLPTAANTSSFWTRNFVCTAFQNSTCTTQLEYSDIRKISRDIEGSLYLINSDDGSPYLTLGTVYKIIPSDMCSRAVCDQQELGLSEVSFALHHSLLFSISLILTIFI